MRLRTRVMLILVLAFAALGAVLLGINGVLAVQRFHQLEDEEVAAQVARLRAQLARCRRLSPQYLRAADGDPA